MYTQSAGPASSTVVSTCAAHRGPNSTVLITNTAAIPRRQKPYPCCFCFSIRPFTLSGPIFLCPALPQLPHRFYSQFPSQWQQCLGAVSQQYRYIVQRAPRLIGLLQGGLFFPQDLHLLLQRRYFTVLFAPLAAHRLHWRDASSSAALFAAGTLDRASRSAVPAAARHPEVS